MQFQCTEIEDKDLMPRPPRRRSVQRAGILKSLAFSALVGVLAVACSTAPASLPTPDVQRTVAAQVPAGVDAKSAGALSSQDGTKISATVVSPTAGTLAAPTVGAVAPPTPERTTATATLVPAVPKLTNANWNLALSDANSYKGASVSLVGRVFLNPEVSSNYVAFQMYTTKDASDGNTLIIGPAGITVNKNNYVRVDGTLSDMFEGQNALGAKLQAPRVRASKVDVISREAAIAPAIKAYTGDAPVAQHDMTITLDRVELAERETRLYMTVNNDSQLSATVYANEMKLVQGSKQFEPSSAYDTGYPGLPTTLLPGVHASTVILFGAVAPEQPFKVVWDGPHLSDYRVKFTPYQWSVGGAAGTGLVGDSALGQSAPSAPQPTSPSPPVVSRAQTTPPPRRAPSPQAVAAVMASTVEADNTSEHFVPAGPPATASDGGGGTLTAEIGMRTPSTDGHGRLVFFWRNDEFLGWDGSRESLGILNLTTSGPGGFVVTYANYAPNDPFCCPSLAPISVTYRWDGQHIQLTGSLPTRSGPPVKRLG